jgi:hypothetical protein
MAVVFASTIVLMIAVYMCLFLPLILRIEASKTQVREIFTSIPRPIRKALRQRVYSVYKLTSTSKKTLNDGVDSAIAESTKDVEGPAEDDNFEEDDDDQVREYRLYYVY